MNIDWSKAPGATHYDNRPGYAPAFLRQHPNGRDWECLCIGGNWAMYGPISSSQFKHLIKRTPPWNGKGVPPVGTVCELKFSHWNCWESCIVLCIGLTMVFVQQTKPDGKIWEGSMCREGVMFRPQRTAEQIAAEDRENAVEDMANISERLIPSYALYQIYDAGYRKQVTK